MRHLVNQRQRGQVVVIMGLGMLALIGVLALVADVGILWETQRELQKTSDSAALAGIIALPGDPDGAVQRAQSYAKQNQGIAQVFCSAAPVTDARPGQHDLAGGGSVYTLTVTTKCTAGLFFGRVLDGQSDGHGLGGNNLDTIPNTVDNCDCLRASATAVIGSLRTAGCPAPFGVTDANEGLTEDGTPIYDGDAGATLEDMSRNGFGYAFGQLVALHVDTATSSYGNFHALDLGDGSGGSAYRQDVGARCNQDLGIQAGQTLTTEPGDMTGPTQQGLSDRGLVDCSGSGQPDLCNDNYPVPHQHFDLACPDDPFDHNGHVGVLNPDGSVKTSSSCLATTPVTTPLSFVDANGRSNIAVEGFAKFLIVGWDKSEKTVWGMFVYRAPSLGDVGAYDPLGTVVTRLIR
jgi:hypothetical protein